ncbi:MAG: hypothetical protein ABR521_08975, partial [Gaiellaceae bacterium]
MWVANLGAAAHPSIEEMAINGGNRPRGEGRSERPTPPGLADRMSALPGNHSLGQLAAAANREHLACDHAYGAAIRHALRAGELLLAAKS